MSNITLKIVPDDFETAYTELIRLKESLAEYQEKLIESYTTMSVDWNGAAGAAFGEFTPTLLEDYTNLISTMTRLAEDIKKVGDEMQSLDSRIAQTVKMIESNLLNW